MSKRKEQLGTTWKELAKQHQVEPEKSLFEFIAILGFIVSMLALVLVLMI